MFNARLRRASIAAAASLLIVGAGTVLAPHANAERYETGDRFQDCGPDICTIYWSRPKSAEIYADTQDPSWTVVRASVVYTETTLSRGGMNRNQATLDGIEDAAGAAVTYNGCLQYAYRKDGTGRAQWGYTTNTDYCWDPANFQF